MTTRICCEIDCTATATWEIDYGAPGNDPYSQSDSCDVHLAELARGFGPLVTLIPLTSDTCPDCGSDDPAKQRVRGPGQRHCPNTWHARTSTTCTNCNGWGKIGGQDGPGDIGYSDCHRCGGTGTQ